MRDIGRAVMLAGGIVLLAPAGGCAQNAVGEHVPHSTVQAEAAQTTGGIRSVPGIHAGHHTLESRPTGCTVVLVPAGAIGGVDVRGGAPGTRETDLLDPVNTVERVHGIVLSGGSAFGLETATGVSRFLEERDIGFPAGPVRVPIVPAAILFDLSIGDPSIRPGADCGYRAAEAAMDPSGPLTEGNVGAGAGATVGKIAGFSRAMKGGIGTAAIELESGLIVAAIVAVNPVGDVVDPVTGEVLAGVRTAEGDELAFARRILRQGDTDTDPPNGNTVIGVVATNAELTKAEATKVAQMAHDGLARTIVPSHTPWDGDTIFALATGEHALVIESGLTVVGALAADAVSEAIVRAVRAAVSLEGLPAWNDLPPGDAPPRDP